MRRNAMKIGELAKSTGATAKTIRYYESIGLLEEPQRTESGYRLYGTGDADRLEFVKKAKRLGLSLEEIRSIIQLYRRKEPTCLHVRSLLDSKLDQADRAIADLQEFRAELARIRDESGTIGDCRPSGGHICGIIERSGFGIKDEALTWLEPSLTTPRRRN